MSTPQRKGAGGLPPALAAPTQSAESVVPAAPEALPARPRELGGVDGPEPTRFGDWEKNGRCIDF